MDVIWTMLIIANAFQVLTAETEECECGKAADTMLSMRIVGGRRALPHSYPWTIAIIKEEKMHCGGAIITNKHILSAGHCFKWDDYTQLDVLLGLDKFDDQTNVERRDISDVVIHENFTSTSVRDENDIAIATLDKAVTFGEKIIPICLPKPGQRFDELAGTIVGWGRQGVNLTASNFLLKATLKILTDEECSQSRLAENLTPTMMCAFFKGKDGCQGDSGGPLLVLEASGKYVQAGIVSWGIGCADPRYPGVYTKVSNYIDWIKSKITGGLTCS